jgi:hypothetical protein
MQGFEPCRESANLSGRTNLRLVPERHGPNVEVAGETPVGPTILIAPWRNTSAVGFDPTGHRGIRWGAATFRRQSVESDARPW